MLAAPIALGELIKLASSATRHNVNAYEPSKRNPNSLLATAYFAGIFNEQLGPLRPGMMYLAKTDPTRQPGTVRSRIAVNVDSEARETDPPTGSYSAIVNVHCGEETISVISWRRYDDRNLAGGDHASESIDPPLTLSLKGREPIDPLVDIARRSCMMTE